METYELSPAGRKSIATFRTLEQAQVLLSTPPDVRRFHIYSTAGLGAFRRPDG